MYLSVYVPASAHLAQIWRYWQVLLRGQPFLPKLHCRQVCCFSVNPLAAMGLTCVTSWSVGRSISSFKYLMDVDHGRRPCCIINNTTWYRVRTFSHWNCSVNIIRSIIWLLRADISSWSISVVSMIRRVPQKSLGKVNLVGDGYCRFIYVTPGDAWCYGDIVTVPWLVWLSLVSVAVVYLLDHR